MIREFYEGQKWLETKIGRENNARVNLNPFASNESGFLIFPQKSRKEGKGGEGKRENWTRKSLKQDRGVYAILYFPRNGVRGNEPTNGLIVVTRKNIASEHTPRFNAGKYHFFHFSTSGD